MEKQGPSIGDVTYSTINIVISISSSVGTQRWRCGQRCCLRMIRSSCNSRRQEVINSAQCSACTRVGRDVTMTSGARDHYNAVSPPSSWFLVTISQQYFHYTEPVSFYRATLCVSAVICCRPVSVRPSVCHVGVLYPDG